MDSAKQQTENPATNWARYRRFALAFVTLGIFLVSLIYSFVKTRALEERIGNQVTTTMWLVSQAEIEFLRFMTTLERYHNGDPTVLHEDLAQSFDTFRSRMPVTKFATSTGGRSEKRVATTSRNSKKKPTCGPTCSASPATCSSTGSAGRASWFPAARPTWTTPSERSSMNPRPRRSRTLPGARSAPAWTACWEG